MWGGTGGGVETAGRGTGAGEGTDASAAKKLFKTAKNFFISVTFMKTATENPQWRTPYHSFVSVIIGVTELPFAILVSVDIAERMH